MSRNCMRLESHVTLSPTVAVLVAVLAILSCREQRAGPPQGSSAKSSADAGSPRKATADIDCPPGTDVREGGGEPSGLRILWCEKDDGLQHGPSRAWYRNGQLGWERNYRDGAQDGVEREWYDDGRLQSEANYIMGQPEGIVRMWHPNGQLASETQYRDGGCVNPWRYWDKKGKLLEEVTDCTEKMRVTEETIRSVIRR
jgi:hypothetical protein